MSDLRIFNHGSVCILAAETDAGEQWLDDNIGSEAMQWGGGVVVEPRYIDAIAAGAAGDGLTVEVN